MSFVVDLEVEVVVLIVVGTGGWLVVVVELGLGEDDGGEDDGGVGLVVEATVRKL